MERILHSHDITIYQGKAEMWPGEEHVDLVLTNPYGYLPLSLAKVPMVIHQWVHRKTEAEEWTCNQLDHLVGTWNDGREAFWSANLPRPFEVDIKEFRPEPGGWYPERMVRRLLTAFGETGYTVWDGFMGRGTVAKVCRDLEMKYVGVEELPRHVALALDYLEIAT